MTFFIFICFIPITVLASFVIKNQKEDLAQLESNSDPLNSTNQQDFIDTPRDTSAEVDDQDKIDQDVNEESETDLINEAMRDEVKRSLAVVDIPVESTNPCRLSMSSTFFRHRKQLNDDGALEIPLSPKSPKSSLFMETQSQPSTPTSHSEIPPRCAVTPKSAIERPLSPFEAPMQNLRSLAQERQVLKRKQMQKETVDTVEMMRQKLKDMGILGTQKVRLRKPAKAGLSKLEVKGNENEKDATFVHEDQSKVPVKAEHAQEIIGVDAELNESIESNEGETENTELNEINVEGNECETENASGSLSVKHSPDNELENGADKKDVQIESSEKDDVIDQKSISVQNGPRDTKSQNRDPESGAQGNILIVH